MSELDLKNHEGMDMLRAHAQTVIDASRAADVLVHEATFADEDWRSVWSSSTPRPEIVTPGSPRRAMRTGSPARPHVISTRSRGTDRTVIALCFGAYARVHDPSGETVAVTGAATGLGFAIARAFGSCGGGSFQRAVHHPIKYVAVRADTRLAGDRRGRGDANPGEVHRAGDVDVRVARRRQRPRGRPERGRRGEVRHDE